MFSALRKGTFLSKNPEFSALRISPFIEAEMHLVAVVFFRELAAIFLRQLTFRHEKAFPVWASLLLHLTGFNKIQDICIS